MAKKDTAPCDKSMKTMLNIHDAYCIHQILLPVTFTSKNTRSRFGSKEELIAERDAYFSVKAKSFHKNGIVMLEERWHYRIALEAKLC